MSTTLEQRYDTLWPVSFDDVRAARDRIRPFIPPTPLRTYGTLDTAVGAGIRLWVKHENFQPTNAFKIRNGLSFMTALSESDRARGVVAASRGNHGLGLAWAGQIFGAPVTICVPHGNNPEKNAGIRALGARVIEEGRDYDESVVVAARLVAETGAHLAHSTNDRRIIAGAATMSLEVLEEEPALDALVLSLGGGSQAVGALTVARELRPGLEVYAVQAAGAAASCDAWRSGIVRTLDRADTFADGLATRTAYELTLGTLREGLTDFVTVTDAQIASALRLLVQTTHSLVEGAGAAGLAGVFALRDRLAGKRVGIVISGGNIDMSTLRQVVSGEI